MVPGFDPNSNRSEYQEYLLKLKEVGIVPSILNFITSFAKIDQLGLKFETGPVTWTLWLYHENLLFLREEGGLNYTYLTRDYFLLMCRTAG
jgi:hypothetical protein